jgi:hypothetical protein
LSRGAYAELGVAYRISRPVSLYTGAQFQYLDSFQQNANGRSARLDFNKLESPWTIYLQQALVSA